MRTANLDERLFEELTPLRDANDAAAFGGKAATLATLIQLGHRVPEGYVLAVDPELERVTSKQRRMLSHALEALGGTVALRSSALAEDGDRASFAGQLESRLNLASVDALADALMACVASGHRAEPYRRAVARGADGGIAVIVQRMVAAERAGVAFTVDPRTGDDQVVIEAVTGLGDALMSGTVAGERWTVTDDEARGADDGVLDAQTATAIAALARQLARELDAPQDVEWALADGELHVLQARPVTTVPIRPRLDDPVEGQWLRDEAHYPSTMTAFGASTYGQIVPRAMSAASAEFGLVVDRLVPYWRSGDVYFRMIPVGGNEGPPPPWWVLALVSRLHPRMRARMRTAERAVTSGLFEETVAAWDHQRHELAAEIRTLDDIDRTALSDAELLAHLDAILDLMERGQRIHFRLFMPWIKAVHRFVETARELLGWPDEEATRLLRSAASSAPTAELSTLASAIVASGAQGIESATDMAAALAEHDAELARELARWRRRWGLRASSYDPGAPTLAEQPGLLDDMLRQALTEPRTPRGPDESLLARARAALPSDTRARFESAWSEAARIHPLREDNVLYTDNLICGLARRAVVEVGRRLHDRGRLRRADDVVELEIDEIRAALRSDDDVSDRAHRRRCERAWVAAHPGPSVLNGPPHQPPDVRGLPRHGREINAAMMWTVQREFPHSNPDHSPRRGADHALVGIGAWPGSYEGAVRVVRSDADLAKVRAGDVMVAPITVPAWSVVFARIGALVTDTGGVLSHAAIVAREHGIPTVLGTGDATVRLVDGQRVRVDGARGRVVVEG